MAETLGSLLDKLSVLKIRQWNTDDLDTFDVLEKQECLLEDEIDRFFHDAIHGLIPHSMLSQPSFKTGNNGAAPSVYASIAANFCRLAEINCEIWDDVDKSRQPRESFPDKEWHALVNRLAYLNLQRNQYKEAIDRQLSDVCKS